MNRSSSHSNTPEWTGSLPEHVDASMVEERLIALLEQLQQAIGQLAQSEDTTKTLARFFGADAVGLYVSRGPGRPMELIASHHFPASAPKELSAGLHVGGDGELLPPIQIQVVDNRNTVWSTAADDGAWRDLTVYGLPRCTARLVLAYSSRRPRRILSSLVKMVLNLLADAVVIQQLQQNRSDLSDETVRLRHMMLSGLDFVKEGVILLDAAGKVVSCNSLAGKLLGYAADEIEGLPAGDVLASWQDVNELVQKVLTGSSSMESLRVTLFHRFGEPVPVRLRIAPLKLPQANIPYGAIAIFADQHREPMEEVEKNLREENARLERMMSILAHEIRNPLGSIKAGLDFLEPVLSHDPSAVEDLQVVQGEIGRMNRLLTDALLVTRPTELQTVPTQVTDVLDGLLAGRKKMLSECNIQLGRQYEPSLPLILLDRAQMEQVFDNLIINAVHAMAKGGHLTLRASSKVDYNGGDGRARTYVEIQVSDSGPGIPEERLARIFDPFFTTKPGGTGLGLAVARRIVGLHNGTLQVNSWPSIGTIFTITLPVEEPVHE